MQKSPPTESSAAQPKPSSGFDYVAGFYELLAHLYSGGQIAAAKASQIRHMTPGQKVLYVGVGAGEDAELAARKGVQLVCLDSSPGMLDRLSRRIERFGGDAELICEDAFAHQRWGFYDVVVANFFLNCFDAEHLPRIMDHLVALIRPGGRLMIADVALPQGNVVYRFMHRAHNFVGHVLFWTIGLVPLHPIWNYRKYFSPLGLQLEQVDRFRLLKIGPIAYESLIARRDEDPARPEK